MFFYAFSFHRNHGLNVEHCNLDVLGLQYYNSYVLAYRNLFLNITCTGIIYFKYLKSDFDLSRLQYGVLLVCKLIRISYIS